MEQKFKALLVEETAPKTFSRRVTERRLSDLPDGDLVVRVRFSSLNFKDALSAIGHPGVSRKFPHTPGIDAAGEVVTCGSGRFAPGDEVVVTGRDLGMNTPGGYGQFIRVPSDWAVPLPPGLSLREAMILGTAGFTAAQSLLKLVAAGVEPGSGDILVTGATGGVGSIAVALLAKAGYRVVASSGKAEAESVLKGLGAAEVIPREAVVENSERPMLKERWAGVIDCVGGQTLAAALKATRYGGSVTCCGLVGSPDLTVNVYPFILRGVSLLGVDSAECPMVTRLEVWKKLSGPWKLDDLEELAEECGLEELDPKIEAILKGKVTGRTLVRLD